MNSIQYEKLFKQALLIRKFEEKIIELYPSDKIQSPVHLSIGQEAVAVGVCSALKQTDLLFGTYRSHAFYIAKGGKLTEMMAELYGKVTGSSKGKAGSMHLTDPDVGFMGSSAVVSSTIPHAVGAAYAAKLRKTGQVIVCVFGDGAVDEGVYHESLNFACLHRLPILFVCENNDLAVHSSKENRQSFEILSHAGTYGLDTKFIPEGYDFEKINTILSPMICDLRKGGKPMFVEIKTFRYMEHVGVGDDFKAGYRSEEEFRQWKQTDPLCTQLDLVNRFLPEVTTEIQHAVEFAEESPWPTKKELLSDVT
jgi:pyruvate dehydrogenase E1 component alpha subunit